MNCCRVDVLSPVYESEVNEPLVLAPEHLHPEKTTVENITYFAARLKEDDQDEISESDEEIFFSASTHQYVDDVAETEEVVNSKLESDMGCQEVAEEAGVSGSHLYKTDIYDFCKPAVFLDLIHFLVDLR